jgi:CPA2 family monovalent cation:H+ antiporter-2
MGTEYVNLKIVLILTVGFSLAAILGYLTQRIKLSPILGYLIGGYLIGPYFPGYVADIKISEQLAEIGVILMMFGVGLHFKWRDLMNVKNIAIPGAVGQTLATTLTGAFLIYSIGWSWESGVIFGLAVGVASTVVLVRVLTDNRLLDTPQGHVCIGWLIVEDIITVIALLLVPILAPGAEMTMHHVAVAILFALFKFLLLITIMFSIGRTCVSYVFTKVVETQSQELFTLTFLALTFVIATGSALIFGTSIALGAFIAGMVIGQTDVKHQVSRHVFPLKDTFIVIFFLTVGMIFNPYAIVKHYFLFAGMLAIILLLKPMIALLITWLLRYPFKTALTVSLALAQIGEFSFILAEEAMKYKILPDEGYDIIVACALVSIAVNPLLFKLFAKNLGVENASKS